MAELARESSSRTKSGIYQELCAQLSELLREESNLNANAANTAAVLFHSLPNLNWAGFYWLDERNAQSLVLGPFQGKPACGRIRLGQGVCGSAAARQETLVVPDVMAFPGHIVCDPESRSEIVIPLMNWGRLLGVMDVDSPMADRFDEDDREGLESIAAVFVASVADGDLPEFDSSVLDG